MRIGDPALHPALPALALLLSLVAPALGQPAQTPPAPSAASAASTARISSLLDSLARVRTPQTVAISPDGFQLAWTVDGPRGSELHLTSLAPSNSVPSGRPTPDRILSPDTIASPTNNRPSRCSAAHPAWSPDGTQLAFLSNCFDSASPDSAGASHDPAAARPGSFQPTTQQNLFVWTLASNGIAQVSHLHGEVSDLQWSPDGQAIAFLFVENATRRAGALDAMKPWSGVIGEDGVEVQRVAAVGANNSYADTFWYLTPATLHAYEFSWAPNSQQIAFVAAKPPGENNWWVAQLYTRYVQPPWRATGQLCPRIGDCLRLTSIFDPATTPGPLHGLQIAVPRFSPDGKSIAFIGGLMSDQGATGGDIYLIPSNSPNPNTQPIDLTPNRPASPAWIAWLDSGSLLVSERLGGSSHLTQLDIHTAPNGAITTIDNPAINLTLPASVIAGEDVFSLSLSSEKSGSHANNVALIKDSFNHPPEVFAGPLDHLQQITHLNDALSPAWGRAESIDYTHDGFHLQGWLLYPTDYNPAKKYPLIVSVHGGPSSAVTPRWPTVNYGAVPFSALGYFVFMPNPRGSLGQGEAFTQANVKDFGYGDLRDILAGVDLLEKRLPIDPAREGITGWSYGGFMTMFVVTQTTRFKAAVAGAGISNWQSYYGENSIDQWMIPFFGSSVYDSPAVYAKSSAINFIKNAKTPTLLVVGDRDGECPAPQSFEFWHALRDQGVKTQLVVYPSEGHHFVDPGHQRDVLARALDWFETQMPPTQ